MGRQLLYKVLWVVFYSTIHESSNFPSLSNPVLQFYRVSERFWSKRFDKPAIMGNQSNLGGLDVEDN